MTNGIMPKLEYLNPPKYDQYPKYRDYLRKVTDFSCAYCTISESESPGATFNIDHFRPQKEFPSLEASCENLRYTCPRCNSYKRSRWIQRTAGCIRDCKTCVADGLFCREIDGLFCRSSPDIIVRRRCVLSHKRRGWLQPSPSFRYSRNLALQDELYHPVINNGPAVLVCVDKRLGTGPVNQSRDAG